jgi:ribosomal protein L15
MVQTHKRKKTTRIRGARTCGWGFRQKHKGHGNKGGFGKAGTGKRADHKKQSAEMGVKGSYFGKQGATSRGTKRKHDTKINLADIQSNYNTTKPIKLPKHTILGNGDGFKGEIIAAKASKTAIQKMEKAGGKITLPQKKEKVVKEEVKKEEGKEDKKEAKSEKKKK